MEGGDLMQALLKVDNRVGGPSLSLIFGIAVSPMYLPIRSGGGGGGVVVVNRTVLRNQSSKSRKRGLNLSVIVIGLRPLDQSGYRRQRR